MTTITLDRVNRTGIEMAGERGARLLQASQEMSPSSEGDDGGIHDERLSYAAEGHVIGSMPAGIEGVSAHLFDKLGERLAFERTGVRLYDAMCDKLRHEGSFEGGPRLEDLERIRDEEAQHFVMLERVIRERGGDPTVVTPAADVTGTMGSGITKVLADPRTTLAHGLEALLTVELTDNASWESLVELAQKVGAEELEQRFADAVRQEEEHLTLVKRWLSAFIARMEPLH